jgi:hypothetical protein
MTEAETLAFVCAGRSLARFGDGEFNLALGGKAKRQKAHPGLRERLCGVLSDPGDCLVGIPNLRAETPKAAFWAKYQTLALPLLSDRPYGSAFVTRPDSAPWIDRLDYWQQVESLWRGQRVVLVRGDRKSFTAADLTSAAQVTEVVGPSANAWAKYHSLMAQVMEAQPARVLLCLGPTATVMAVDLSEFGVHAVDVGHLGMFWKKHLRGDPMVVTAEDKAA